jgi:hypothetical protein
MTGGSTTDRAERAGRAAKTSQRRRRERERVVGLATTALLGVPLLFAAVWCRMEVSQELRRRDDRLAKQCTLERSLVELQGERTRLMTWPYLGMQAKGIGLREPSAAEVMWVPVRGETP